MRNIFTMILIASFATAIFGCKLGNVNSTEEINLSEGISILVTQDAAVIIDSKEVPVDKVLEKLELMKVKITDVIVIKVSPRASQRPVLQILDQLGDAKYNNITITSGK